MLTPIPEYALPYTPIPLDRQQSILGPIREGLLQREFAPSAILPDYVFTAEKKGLKVHQTAFTDPLRKDPLTSAVNFYYNAERLTHQGILRTLVVSGAPFNLIGDDDSASLYILSQAGQDIQLQEIVGSIAYEQIPSVFARYGVDIAPRRIERAKLGFDSFVLFPQFNPLQLRLFAVDATGQILVEHFSAAVQTLRNAMRRTRARQDEKDIAVQLLAAVVLAHKGVLGDKCAAPNAPLALVIREAHRKFSRYFTPSDIAQYDRAAEQAYAILQQVRYSSFTPDILELLYIKAYPEAERRKWEGRYNTPLYLTQRILNNIPIETIPPTQRIVVDMTCGVGNFLQAAHQRLDKLPDMQDSNKPLREHIFGNDKDEFTAKLAGLSLLLTSLSDRWHIDFEDALTWQWLKRANPTVIVGNPPFFGSRKSGAKATELDTETGRPKRHEKAGDFLEKAIECLAPGGYLAMVMPQSFTVSQASPSTRKLLLESCDVLEIWELPNEMFSGVAVQPMVLFAQRKSQEQTGRISSTPVRVRTMQRNTKEEFRQNGAFTASSMAISQASWGADSKLGPQTIHVMGYQLILTPQQWAAIQQRTRRLDQVADITQGAIIGSRSRWRWVDYEKPRRVKWLSNPKLSMPHPYHIEYGSATVIYPNELEEPRKNHRFPHLDKEYLLAGDKVLLVSDPNPSWGRRAKVAVETQGYYPSDSFWVLVSQKEQPKHISVKVLAAVVGWYVSNAWIIEYLKEPKILLGAIESIPFPHKLAPVDCRKLESAIRKLEAAAERDQDAPDAQRIIDQVLKAAYGLDDATFERLKMVAEWNGVDLSTLTKSKPNPATLMLVTGGVEEVDAQNETLTLWLNGFTGLHKTRITDEMPGWLLRPGAAFRAEIPEDNYRRQNLERVIWVNITPQGYTYLDEKGLLEHLSTIFSANDPTTKINLSLDVENETDTRLQVSILR